MANGITHLNSATFDETVAGSTAPVLVDFWAEWCAPCRAIAPIVKELADEYKGRVKIVKVNIDESQQTPGTYGIRSIPTVLAFQGGQVVGQLQGARPKAAFQEMVEGLV